MAREVNTVDIDYVVGEKPLRVSIRSEGQEDISAFTTDQDLYDKIDAAMANRPPDEAA